MGKKPFIFAHRGASAQAPVNTIRAFECAATLGADGIELDVRRTKDGHLVVIHDETVDATTNGAGRVADLTLNEMQRLDAGEGERIPTLDAVFASVGTQFSCINVEIKEVGIEPDVLTCIRRHQMAEHVLLSSFQVAVLHACVRLAPEIPVAFLFSQPSGFAEADHWQILHPRHTLVTPEQMALWRQTGKIINAWTVNEPIEMQRLIDLGIDGIITDVPDMIPR
jgi:glycerophosphoryl diester phosphodiesterase